MTRRNEVLAFRGLLAEGGTEMTPDQAEKAYEASRKMIKRSKSMSMLDIWSLRNEEVEGFSEEELDDMIGLYMRAKEL